MTEPVAAFLAVHRAIQDKQEEIQSDPHQALAELMYGKGMRADVVARRHREEHRDVLATAEEGFLKEFIDTLVDMGKTPEDSYGLSTALLMIEDPAYVRWQDRAPVAPSDVRKKEEV